jgi:hypothetical protein
MFNAIRGLMELDGSTVKNLNLIKGFKVLSQCQKKTFENQHFQTNIFQRPVFGIQECRNLHDVWCSTGISQAFRSSFFTSYDIM